MNNHRKCWDIYFDILRQDPEKLAEYLRELWNLAYEECLFQHRGYSINPHYSPIGG